MNNWLNFGGDPDHRLDTGIVFRNPDSSLLGDTESGNEATALRNAAEHGMQ